MPNRQLLFAGNVLGPDATLRRGYSITMNECGQIIRTIAAVRPKMKIHTRVRDGEFGSEILSEKIFAEGNKANEDSD